MIHKELQYLFARIRGQAVLRLPNLDLSARFRAGNRLEATKILIGGNNRALLEGFLREIKPGDVVFDIGANIGQYTLPAAVRAGASGEVHAFEPAPIWMNRLRENVRLNSISNVITHPVGLSDRSGQRVFMFKNTQGSGMGSFIESYQSHVQKQKLERIQIRIEHGDQYLSRERISSPDVVKIDVEGAELEVLRGLEQGCRKKQCRFILCEVHPDYLEEPVIKVEERLGEYGFDTEIKESKGPPFLYHIFARKSS